MMNHDPILSERGEGNLAQLSVYIVSPKNIFAGEITKNESNVFVPLFDFHTSK